MEAAGCAIETLIFVDIDGVLNVGVQDASAPIMLSEQNCELALKHHSAGNKSVQVEKMLAVMERPTGSNAAGLSLRELACRGSDLCSEPLVARLAAIIAAASAAAGAGVGAVASSGAASDVPTAGPSSAAGRVRVVLASNWRKPKYSDKVRSLEQLLSSHLNRPFRFDDTTRAGADSNAADRLRCIGDYVQGFRREARAVEECGTIEGGLVASSQLRVLVLDDFFITPMHGWNCDGATIQSIDDAEAYLGGLAPSWPKVSVRILHPFVEWKSRSGIRIQVATGLTQRHCIQAAAFLYSSGANVAATAVQQPHLHCPGGCTRMQHLQGSAVAQGRLLAGNYETLTRLPIQAASFLQGKARSSLTSSFPIEYLAVAFFTGLVLQSLIYSA